MERKYKYNYPTEIEEFFEFYEGEEFNTHTSVNELNDYISKIQEYLISEYKRIFKTDELLKEEYISESIFPDVLSKIQNRQRIKINLCSIINVLNHLEKELKFYTEKEIRENNNFTNFKSKTIAIYYLIDDYMQFYANHYDYFHRSDKPLLMMRRIESFTIYDSVELSSQLLKGNIEYKYFSMNKVLPGAISYIRQTVELILKNSLNIHKISNKEGKPYKLSGYIFLEFFKIHQNEIKFPCKFSLLRKVYEWSNHFIHTGNVNYYWTIWEAQFIIYKFFPFKEKFDKSHYIIFEKGLVDNINEILSKYLAMKLKINVDEIKIEFHNKYGGLNTENGA